MQNHDMTFPKIIPRRLRESCFASISRTTYLLFSLPILLSASYCTSASLTQAFSVLFLLSRWRVSTSSCSTEHAKAWRRGIIFHHFIFIYLPTHACSVSLSIGGKTYSFGYLGTSRSHKHTRSAFMIVGLEVLKAASSGAEGNEGIWLGSLLTTSTAWQYAKRTDWIRVPLQMGHDFQHIVVMVDYRYRTGLPLSISIISCRSHWIRKLRISIPL